MAYLGTLINQFLQKTGAGFEIRARSPYAPFTGDIEEDFKPLYFRCKPYTMTSLERMYSVYKAIEYIVANKIPGDIVECGVWKGGSTMMAALALQKHNDTSRKIYLYDTYEGMSEPTDKDIKFDGVLAADKWKNTQKESINSWCYSSLEEVKKNIAATGYPEDQLIFVKGKVEDTIPQTMPQHIAFLRLDTDWYESTKHELIHLFPLVSKGGVLALDDYGHWKGSRDATDEYIQNNNIPMLFHRVDHTGRNGIKLS